MCPRSIFDTQPCVLPCALKEPGRLRVHLCHLPFCARYCEGAGTVDRTLMGRPCAGRGYVRGPDSFHDRCADCDGTGQAEPVKALPVQQHVRQMIRTAWALGHLPEFAHLKL